MPELKGNANIAAIVPIDDYLWLLEQCKKNSLSRSAMVAKIIADARQSAPDTPDAS